MELDSSQQDLPLEVQEGGALSFLLGFSQGLDLESEVRSVLSVDRNFPFDVVGSSVFGLSEFHSESMSS